MLTRVIFAPVPTEQVIMQLLNNPPHDTIALPDVTPESVGVFVVGNVVNEEEVAQSVVAEDSIAGFAELTGFAVIV